VLFSLCSLCSLCSVLPGWATRDGVRPDSVVVGLGSVVVGAGNLVVVGAEEAEGGMLAEAWSITVVLRPLRNNRRCLCYHVLHRSAIGVCVTSVS
jgi:hypothetical protein